MASTTCILAWTHLFIDPEGKFYTCCLASSTLQNSISPQGKILKADQPGALLAHWNSKLMREVRESMRQGEQHSACKPCWDMENNGASSIRQIYNANKSFTQEVDYRAELPDVRFLDLRFGNLCNLACRMCIPYSSKKLVPEYRTLYGDDHVAPYEKLNWYESESFWEELEQITANLKRIHLAGGEPFMIKPSWKYLQSLVENGRSRNIELSYNTNLTILPPQAKELWPHFKSVTIAASMDGVGRDNEYIRYPLNWDNFEKNLKEIDENAHLYNVTNIHVHATFQIYNSMRITEIRKYLEKFKFVQKFPDIDIVYSPQAMSAQNLPRNLKESVSVRFAEEKLALAEQSGNRNAQTYLRNLAALEKFMNAAEPNADHVTEFMRLTTFMDKERNQRLQDFMPEICNSFKLSYT